MENSLKINKWKRTSIRDQRVVGLVDTGVRILEGLIDS